MIAMNSFAQFITMTHTGVGSGTFGSAAFANAAFTITGVGDTANRYSFFGGYSIENISATISIAGVGDFLLTSGTRTFVNNDLGIVGFSRAGSSSSDLFNGPTTPALNSWDMLSSIGPLTGPGQLLQWTSFPVTTSGGTLIFENANLSATFQATLVPEPASGMLVLGGALYCLLFRVAPKPRKPTLKSA